MAKGTISHPFAGLGSNPRRKGNVEIGPNVAAAVTQHRARVRQAATDNPPPAITGDLYDIPVKTSLPDSIYRHDISDEELTMLVDPRRDSLSEQKWAFFGIAGGAFPGAMKGLALYASSGSIDPVDGIQVLMFVTFLVLAIWTKKTDGRLAKSPTDLAAKIRARKGQRVRSHEQQ